MRFKLDILFGQDSSFQFSILVLVLSNLEYTHIHIFE